MSARGTDQRRVRRFGEPADVDPAQHVDVVELNRGAHPELAAVVWGLPVNSPTVFLREKVFLFRVRFYPANSKHSFFQFSPPHSVVGVRLMVDGCLNEPPTAVSTRCEGCGEGAGMSEGARSRGAGSAQSPNFGLTTAKRTAIKPKSRTSVAAVLCQYPRQCLCPAQSQHSHSTVTTHALHSHSTVIAQSQHSHNTVTAQLTPA